MLIILLLGFSAGVPLTLTGTTLWRWMADRGADLDSMVLIALVGLPYGVMVCAALLAVFVLMPCSLGDGATLRAGDKVGVAEALRVVEH